MGSTIIEQDFPYDILHRGQKDAIRHNKRVQDALRKQLKHVIGQQDIISSEGNKKVKVRLKHLDQYRFRHFPDRMDEVGRDEFNDLKDGEILSQPSDGSGKPNEASDEAGDDVYEAEFSLEELTDMMIEELDLPDLDDTKKNEITSDVLEYTDRRKRTGIEACIDKKQTLLSFIKRRATCKDKNIVIDRDDLKFKTWEIAHEKHSNAVIFLLLDRSGSMSDNRIYTVKALYFWIVQFLRRRYEKVEIKFIAHDYTARELTEKEFFSIADSGGTRISAAYELCRDMIKHNYPNDLWNIYCFHASDGDSWNDEDLCMKLVEEIFKLGAKIFAYTEIDRDSNSELYTLLKKAAKYPKMRNLMVASIRKKEDIVETLRKYLKHSSKEAV